MRVFKELETEAGRRGERAHDNWKHASNVGIDLLDSDAWLEPGETVITEVAKIGFVAVKLKWSDNGGIFPVQEVKLLRQDADDLTRFAVHNDIAADRSGVTTKFAAPIAVGKHDGFGSARRIVLLGKGVAQHGRNTEERQSAIRNAQGADLFRFGDARHADGVTCVKTDVLESAVLIAEDEVVGGG